MNIMIIGAGFTGVQLAKRLINEGNIVKIIESNEDIVEHVSNRLDCEVMRTETIFKFWKSLKLEKWMRL